MRLTRVTIWATFCILVMGVPVTRAQQQEPQQQPQQQEDQPQRPIPAYRSPLASAADNGEEGDMNGDPQKLIPDNRSLAGAQTLSLGAPATSHSYWQPHFDFAGTVDSNGLSSATNTGWTTWSSFFGGIDLHRISGNSNMSLSYTGGATLSNEGDASNGIVQSLAFSEKLAFRRATLTLLDQLSYLPETAFGYQGSGALGLPGGGSLGLQPGLPPGQSILTPRGQRLSNAFAPQLDVLLSPRSSITFVGTYSLLHYFDNDLLNYYSAGFQAGYNYRMTRKDTVALVYSFDAFRYSNFNQSINDHVVHVSYARRVTGKLAFQIAAGPEITSFQTPITTSGGATGGTGSPGPTTQVTWSLSSSLSYQMRRTGLSVSYNHGVSGGSGVQAGSINDTVSGSVSRQFSRTFSGNWSVGYARNNGLTIAVPTAGATNQTFGYWFSNVGLNHPIGRTMNVSLNYSLQYQDSNGTFCVGPTCDTSLVRHQISFSLGWHEHPLAF